MSKLAIYTCVFGDYQGLPAPVGAWTDCEFVCFTDKANLEVPGWLSYFLETSEDSVTASRLAKLLPHRYLTNSECSLYLDANIALTRNPFRELEPLLAERPFWAPAHSARSCIFKEAIECLILERADLDKLTVEMARYRAIGMPENFGMTENNILFRSHNDLRVIDLMEEWWRLFQGNTGRDQLSLPVALWTTGFNVGTLPADAGFSLFYHRPHKRDEGTDFIKKVTKKLRIEARRLQFRKLEF